MFYETCELFEHSARGLSKKKSVYFFLKIQNTHSHLLKGIGQLFHLCAITHRDIRAGDRLATRQASVVCCSPALYVARRKA